MLRYSVQVTGGVGAGGLPFRRLDVLPRGALLRRCLRTARTEHMRVTADQLVADGAGHGLEIELARFAGDLRVKHHLEQ